MEFIPLQMGTAMEFIPLQMGTAMEFIPICNYKQVDKINIKERIRKAIRVGHKKTKNKYMKRIFRTITFLAIVIIFTGCASIVSSGYTHLTVKSDPAGADIQIINRSGTPVFSGQTPATVLLKTGAGFFVSESYHVKFTMDGFAEKTTPVNCTLNGWYFGNIIFGGLIGMLFVDPATGAMYQLETNSIHENLSPALTVQGSKPDDSTKIVETFKEPSIVFSYPMSANLYIDHVKAGQTPVAINLSVGEHHVKLIQNNRTMTKTINIVASDNGNKIKLNFED